MIGSGSRSALCRVTAKRRHENREQFLSGEAGTMAFVRTVKVDELPPGAVRELQIEGKAMALANVGGKFYAINNTCLHRNGPLGQGNSMEKSSPVRGMDGSTT